MAKNFAKKFPPLFIAGAVIGVLVVAYKYIFADRQAKMAQNASDMKTVNEQPAQIEQKNLIEQADSTIQK